MQQHIQHNSQRRGGLNKLLLHYTATMLRSRIAAALVARQAGALAYDARFRSKVDGLVARRRGDLLVVLEDCTDPANAASIARVCDGFGVPELLFVTSRRPEPAFDPCGEGLRRLSASATQWVKLTSYSSVEDCYERLRRDGFASAACVMDDDAVLLPATDDAALAIVLPLGFSQNAHVLSFGFRKMHARLAGGAAAACAGRVLAAAGDGRRGDGHRERRRQPPAHAWK